MSSVKMVRYEQDLSPAEKFPGTPLYIINSPQSPHYQDKGHQPFSTHSRCPFYCYFMMMCVHDIMGLVIRGPTFSTVCACKFQGRHAALFSTGACSVASCQNSVAFYTVNALFASYSCCAIAQGCSFKQQSHWGSITEIIN